MVSAKSGRPIGFPPPGQPANRCFAGPDHRPLYLTARTGFYAIRTNVRGASQVK